MGDILMQGVYLLIIQKSGVYKKKKQIQLLNVRPLIVTGA